METLFLIPDLKRAGNFMFRYIVMAVIKVTPRSHLDVKLVKSQDKIIINNNK